MSTFRLSWVKSGDEITASLSIVDDQLSRVLETPVGLRSFDTFQEAKDWAHQEAGSRDFKTIEIAPDPPE